MSAAQSPDSGLSRGTGRLSIGRNILWMRACVVLIAVSLALTALTNYLYRPWHMGSGLPSAGVYGRWNQALGYRLSRQLERGGTADFAVSYFNENETYRGLEEWDLLPPLPGAAWTAVTDSTGQVTSLPLVVSKGVHPTTTSANFRSSTIETVTVTTRRLRIGLYLNTQYHWESLMSLIVYMCLSDRYTVYLWTAKWWPFESTYGRGSLLRRFPFACVSLYTGQVALSDLDALVVASHTFSGWNHPNHSWFTQEEPLYQRWISTASGSRLNAVNGALGAATVADESSLSMKRLVFVLHELAPGSLQVLDFNEQVRVLSIPPRGRDWGLPVLTQARSFLPPLPFSMEGGFSPIKRFLLQGSYEGNRRDYAALYALLLHPLVLDFDGQFEVIAVGAEEYGATRPPALATAPNFRFIDPASGSAKLDEAAYHEHCRAAHFILPMISPRSNPVYFGERFTSSVGIALSYRLLLVAHEAVVRTFGLPPHVALSYSDDRVREGGKTDSLLQAFLKALRMTPTEYAHARAAFGPFHHRLDAENIAALREVIEDP